MRAAQAPPCFPSLGPEHWAQVPNGFVSKGGPRQKQRASYFFFFGDTPKLRAMRQQALQVTTAEAAAEAELEIRKQIK